MVGGERTTGCGATGLKFWGCHPEGCDFPSSSDPWEDLGEHEVVVVACYRCAKQFGTQGGWRCHEFHFAFRSNEDCEEVECGAFSSMILDVGVG
jgi:hypothetical protein